MPKIRVKKHFRFSVAGSGRLPTEKAFTPGDHEITDEMAEHSWIKDHYADGAIETPEETAKRLADEAAKLQAALAEAANAQAEADAAIARLTEAQPVEKKKAKLSAKALNTPLNELRAKQDGGKDAEKQEADDGEADAQQDAA